MYDAFIISDTHLGAHNSEVDRLHKFLKGLPKTERLILNGDILDRTDVRFKKEHWKILTELRKLSDDIEVIYCRGNHDENAGPIAEIIGAKFVPQYQFTSDDKRVLCFHGDSFDDFHLQYPKLTFVAEVGYVALQRIDTSHNLARIAKHSSKNFLRASSKVEKGAVESAQNHEVDIVCCGHTHNAYIKKVENITYANSGCWTERPSSYLAIKKGKVDLHYV